MKKEHELAKNTLILTVGKICTQFVSFLLLPLYTALLSPGDYGVFDLLNTYTAILVPLFNWQFENGLFRFMVECRNDKKRQNNIFSTIIISNTLQAIAYIIFFVLIYKYISSPYKMFLAVDVVVTIYLNTLLQFPRGLGHNASYAVASFISASTAVLFNVILIYIFKLGIIGMFIATIIGKVMSILYLAISQRVWNYFSLSSFSRKDFKEICQYSIPLIPNQLSWWTISVSDRIIVSHFLSVAANGLYSIANKFSSIYITVYNIFNLSWTESVTLHVNDDDRDEFMTETINSMFLLFGCICIGIIACMPFVFPIMINSKYSLAYYQIPILMVAVLFQVVVGLYSVIYVAMKKSVDIAKTSMYSAIINISTNLILIRFIGLYAAAFSTLIAYATMAIYRYFHVKRYINIKLKAKSICILTSMILITILAYYKKILIANGIVLIIDAIISIYLNYDFLKSAVVTVLQKVKK